MLPVSYSAGLLKSIYIQRTRPWGVSCRPGWTAAEVRHRHPASRGTPCPEEELEDGVEDGEGDHLHNRHHQMLNMIIGVLRGWVSGGLSRGVGQETLQL